MLRSFLVFSLPPFAVRFGKYAPLGALQGQIPISLYLSLFARLSSALSGVRGAEWRRQRAWCSMQGTKTVLQVEVPLGLRPRL